MSLPAHAELAAMFLLETAAKMTLVVASAWIATFLLRRRSAALRHQVWLSAIIASLVLPIVAPILPAWHSHILTVAIERVTGPGPAAENVSSSASFVVNAIPTRNSNPIWPELLLFMWAAGFGLGLVRLATGCARMARVRAHSKPLIGDVWVRDTARIATALGISRRVQLLESADPAAMPLAWGLGATRILLPCSARNWNDDRRRIVLSHELAHVARHDCAAQILGELARAVYWFNPLTWLAVARLHRESECACDDSVLNSGIEPRHYAGDLLALARVLDSRPSQWLPALAMARSTHFERRITAMLNPIADRRTSSTKSKLFILLAALMLLLLLGAVRLAGQNAATTFSGTVYGPDGAGSANATVIMIDVRANIRNMTTSDANGRFAIDGLPPGEYEFEVMKLGCNTYDVPNVSLQPGETRSLDANLQSGTPREIPAPPKAIRVSGNVQAGHLFTTVQPKYPAAAKSQGIQGNAILHAFIAKDGTVESLVVSNQVDPLLARSAVEAVSHWRYRPTLLNGEPIAVATDITVVYTLRP